MEIIIDNREPKDIISIVSSKHNTTISTLDIGDYIIKKNNSVISIIERKTLSDLIASIKDGRYSEQSLRLNEYEIDNKYIIYIIEGNIMNFSNKNNEVTQKMIYSAIWSLIFKKKIYCYFDK